MAVTLNASTTTGLVQSADTSGSLNIQSNGTTILGLTSTGIAVTGTHSVTGTQSVGGNLSFNSGYGSSAVAYGCRAWVNFNGTGTVAIRASGNVSSITDNGVGNYTVNFTTAMPDANYAAIGSGFRDVFSSAEAAESFTSYAVGSVNALFATGSSGAAFDTNAFSVAIFR